MVHRRLWGAIGPCLALVYDIGLIAFFALTLALAAATEISQLIGPWIAIAFGSWTTWIAFLLVVLVFVPGLIVRMTRLILRELRKDIQQLVDSVIALVGGNPNHVEGVSIDYRWD